MVRKHLDLDDINAIWGFYLKNQSASAICRACAEAGIKVSRSGIRKYIEKGSPRHGVQPFREKLAEMQAEVVQGVRQAPKPPPPAPPLQVQVNQTVVAIAADALMAWRVDLSQWVGRLARIGKHVDQKIEMLETAAATKDEELTSTMKLIGQAARAHRDFVHCADLLRVMDGTDRDGRDEWLREQFPGWSKEEHENFQKYSIWPESQGPPPAFMLPPGERPTEAPPDYPDLPEPEDSEGVEDEEQDLAGDGDDIPGLDDTQ